MSRAARLTAVLGKRPLRRAKRGQVGRGGSSESEAMEQTVDLVQLYGVRCHGFKAMDPPSAA